MSISLNQPSFAAGILSPELKRRIDLAKYSVGAEDIKNMTVLPRGGVQSRCGTQKLGTVHNSANKARMVDFIFSQTQAYVLEFSALVIRVWKDGVLVLSGGSPYTITTTYTEAEIPYLGFEQSADTLYITHPSHKQATLTRSGDAAWTLASFGNLYGPLRAENATSTTLRIDYPDSYPVLAPKGSTVTVTASAATFNSSHVGSVWGVRHVLYATTYTAYVAAGGGIYTSYNYPVYGEWELTIKPGSHGIDNTGIEIFKSVDEGLTWYKLHTVPATSDTTAVLITGSCDEPAYLQIQRDNVDDDFTFTLNSLGHSHWATFEITGFSSSLQVTAKMQTVFDQCGTAFVTWAEGAWSDYRGWPAAVSFFQDRLGFGGDLEVPNGFWYSKTGDYTNFGTSLPVVDDDAIRSHLLGRKVNPIRAMIPLQAHIVLTSDSEWTIEPQNTGVFSTGAMQIKHQTYFGCADLPAPVIVGDMAVFVTRHGNAVRGMAYDDVRGKQIQDLTIMANHLFDGITVVDWAYQQYPNSILWCVMSDGSLLSFTFHREHEVWAWARHDTAGSFESVCCVPGDGQDDVYFEVNRTIGTTATRFIEVLAHRETAAADYVGVDCSTTFTADTATRTVTGADYLDGAVVEILADGAPVGRATVASGSFTVPKAASKVTYGLPFDYLLKTLQVNAAGQGGTTSDRKKLIKGVTISVLNSRGGKAGQNGQYSNLPYPGNGLYSGDIEQKLIAGWSKDGQFEIIGSGVQPMHIINLTPQVEFGGV